MSKTIALHGTKDLLIQAREDLVKAGFNDDTEWNDRHDFHFESELVSDHLYLNSKIGISYHTHDCNADVTIPLTPENYAETIQSIILKKDELCQTN